MIKASIRRKKRSSRPLPDPDSPRAPQYDALAPELMREYLDKGKDRKNLKVAAVWAFVFHFILFFIVIPTAKVEPIRLTDQMATTIVKRYKPPAPPSKPKKRVKKKTTPIPIPDPTPDDPEPIFDEESEVEFLYDAKALEAAGVDLDRAIRLDVKDAGADAFFRAVFVPLGLKFEIDGYTVRLSPK